MNGTAPFQAGGGGPPTGGPPGGGPLNGAGAGGGRPTLDQILFMAFNSNPAKICSWSAIGAASVALVTGFILIDTVRYFDFFGNTDKRWLKVGVATGSFGCFAHMIICCAQTSLLIDHAFTNFSSISWIDSLLGMISDLFGTYTNFGAASFYTWRAFKLSNRNWWLVAWLLVLNSTQLVLGSVVAIKGMTAPHPTMETIMKLKDFQTSLNPLRKAWGGIAMAADGSVCVVMMYYLFQSRGSVFHREKRVYHKLLTLIVETMLPPVVCVLILDIHANSRSVAIADWRRVLRMLLPPLYFVSLIHSLVSRATIRAMLNDTLASDGIQQLSGSRSKGAVFVAKYPSQDKESKDMDLEASTDHIVSIPLENSSPVIDQPHPTPTCFPSSSLQGEAGQLDRYRATTPVGRGIAKLCE